MQCEAFETRLNQLLDRRVRPENDDHLVAHAQGCEACRELLAVQELLFDGLDLLDKPELSAGFSRRTVATMVEPARLTRSSAPPRWLVFAASLVAVVLVAVVSANRFGTPTDKGERVAGTRKPGKSPGILPGAALVVPGRRQSPAPTHSPAKPTPDALANHDYRSLFEQFPSQLPEMPREAQEVSNGLRPITTSFGVAVGLIRNTLPGGKEEALPPKPQAAAPHGRPFERIG